MLLVHVAEACFQRLLPITNVPTSRELRLRFLGELVAPYERDSILEQCGISSKLGPSQKVDTRVIMAPPATRLHGEESCTLNLNNFDGEALAKVFRERPSEVSNRRCLRILQYVNAIGSACILSSLNAAFDKLPKGNAVQAVDEPVLEKLFHIHLRLVNLEGQDHLFIARHRYIKYCYFETYCTAVQTLREKKRGSRRERQKVSALKLTASYK